MAHLRQNLFFIAVVPPDPLKAELIRIKEIFSQEYSAKAALRSPPHITLHMPFKLTENGEALLEDKLRSEVNKINPFEIRLHNYGAFPPRVIYIDIMQNEELSVLHSAISNVMKRDFNFLNQDYKEKPYHPHLTIGFRDLRKREFERAWNKYKELELAATFIVHAVCLLKHNGKIWEIDREISLAN